jgi:phosphoenolpyruvate-protein phosphotransferase/dihydroxyacetone kinase phosphotransfer subunit
MVGLVLVAHSRMLAEGLASLIKQMANPNVPIAIAAGSGIDQQELGTDATEIAAAIQKVHSADGVLVLMDLGSAILSAEMALDLLPVELSRTTRLCAAPLVEGAIVAAVQSGLGSDLDTVCDEAISALKPKKEHLVTDKAVAAILPEASIQITAADKILSIQLTLQNLHGLHARPAARFVQVASQFNADIQVTNLTKNKGPASAKSINQMATLGAVQNHQIKIDAWGPEATQALQALTQLVGDNFGEAEVDQTSIAEISPISQKESLAAGNAIHGIPVSEGVAVGKLYFYEKPSPPIPDNVPQDAHAEWKCLQSAIEKTRLVIQQRQVRLRERLSASEIAIFDAHQLILQDPELLQSARKYILENGMNAARAWQASISEVAATYAALDEPYQQARRSDVLDVGNQVLSALVERGTPEPIHFSEPVIIYAQELTSDEAIRLDDQQILAVVTAIGGPTSHSAILTRSLGIPAISGLNLSIMDVKPGTLLGVDGTKGLLWIDPGKGIQNRLAKTHQTWLAKRQMLLDFSSKPALTRDERLVEVAANVGSLVDAKVAALNGADGIGVLRTEFLYLGRESPPSEEEQLQTLMKIAETLGNLPLIVRTLDAGGDKPIPYLHTSLEANPFLGVRALRLSFIHPDLFLTQLRAILRAATHHKVSVMFPMVANLDEILKAKDMLTQAHRQLEEKNTPHRWPIKTGIMVEIPSAALLSSVLAPHVDFFSIGTNDLTQYTLAAERGNPELATYSDALHPAVLQLVKKVVDAAHQHAKWTGVCGEIAGDPLAIPILLGLEVDELSMNPTDIPKVKATIRALEQSRLRELSHQALQLESAPEVRQISDNLLQTSYRLACLKPEESS